MTMHRVTLKRGREKWIAQGHPWVFSAAVAGHPVGASPGDVVDVVDRAERFVARGFYNPGSSIPVRVLTREVAQKVDRELILSRIQAALARRRPFLDPSQTTAYRLVHSENDFLPGLVVDRYAGYLVVQFHTLGMDLMREIVVDALQEALSPEGIFERSDVGARNREGLESLPVGSLRGQEPPPLVEFQENGARFVCDVRHGQKTGFFLDQRENRRDVGELCSGGEVLNAFSYSGGFSVFAALGGARRVVSVDASAPALELGRQNLDLNGIDPDQNPFIEANVFDYLKECASGGEHFDVVVLDPPAFAKSKASLERATRAYIRLNRMALEILNPGGYLATASCSSAVDAPAFTGMLAEAAARAKREVSMIRTHLQSVDHPLLTSFPEGQYLKCIFCSAV